MKLLVFAHKPPPHHGQSFMVGMVLKVLCRSEPGTESFEIFHVNARLSNTLSDVGQAGMGKVFKLLGFCAKAVFWRFRYGVTTLYHVPAPPHRVAILRDWIALGLCRPFFKTTIYHWHASGMGEWLEKTARPWERLLTGWTISHPNLSIILREGNRIDPEALRSEKTVIVPYGIPDPCPLFETQLEPRRIARASARRSLHNRTLSSGKTPSAAEADPHVFRILFMSLCVREKGLFDLIEAVAILGEAVRHSNQCIELAVTGSFVKETEKLEFEQRIACPDLNNNNVSVRYHGFVSGQEKGDLFTQTDCFCFPTFYEAESFGLVSVEAMAYGLPLIVSNWRGLPELLPAHYPWVVPPHSPSDLALQLQKIMTLDWDGSLRQYFLEHYTEEQFALKMRQAILSAVRVSTVS